jgi:hypothetical protein
MQLITHQLQIDKLSYSIVKAHVQARFDQLHEETDVPPVARICPVIWRDF